MKDFEVAAVFMYSYEYAVLKVLLEQRNIPYFFENENTIGVLPLDSIALGGIRLKVHKNDLEKVQNIIDRLNNKDNPLEIV